MVVASGRMGLPNRKWYQAMLDVGQSPDVRGQTNPFKLTVFTVQLQGQDFCGIHHLFAVEYTPGFQKTGKTALFKTALIMHFISLFNYIFSNDT